MRVTLMHNPTAGGEEHSGADLVEVISGAGHDVTYQSTDDEEWQAALEGSDLVVVAGGDGTVREVFKELAGRDARVTVLPLGSANNIATSLGLAGRPAESLVAGWPEGVLRPYDLGEVEVSGETTRFVESVGGGLFAEVLARAERTDENPSGEDKVELGLRLLGEVVAGARPVRWHIELDGADLSGDLLAVEALNVGETGPSVPLAPAAEPGDGLLDVVLIGEEDRESLAAYVEARLGEREAAPPRLDVRRGRSLSLRADGERGVHVDDVLADGSSAAEARAGTEATRLQVLVPPGGRQT